ncbi:peptidylprolyl isomerase [Prevotella sp. E9-3]|uniref:peptidylprolyl isomerase n=1 Tax=Prevotella sp. E9-3 TaxID=2913621 RepID=UPI001EDC7391|nr:peptidylprolyl isomerase [Prevotella sp. E9-3]UKK47793.1 peptidylprolyl isomerase [Prevotella sp. E9-3]
MKNTGTIILLLMMAVPLLGIASSAKEVTTVNAADSTEVGSTVDEVVWVVGDEAILKSDIEVMRIQAAMEGVRWERNPDCAIPERIAVQKLFLHQAAIDSIEVTESEVSSQIEARLDYMISQIGSREKLEEYRKQSISQIRAAMHDELRDQMMIQRMKEHLAKNVIVTPAEVRRYFKELSPDSIPFVPTTVEVQIIAQTPTVAPEEINRVKDELRDFTDRVMSGQSTFQTLARLYSEDPGSARKGGELDYTGRGMFDPAFANVAFNLTDPKKISKIVESEFGYHIIQLIDKRGDKVKVRHILLKPEVNDSSINASLARLDSVATDIRAGKFTFEEGATFISDDKNTRNNRGLMANQSGQGQTSKFQLQDLPSEVAKVVDTLQVGQISKPFTMINDRGKTVCVIAKLKSRTEGHKATITEDFQVMKDVVLEKRRAEALHKWVVDKIKNTYVRINDNYRDCDFEYQGWVR